MTKEKTAQEAMSRKTTDQEMPVQKAMVQKTGSGKRDGAERNGQRNCGQRANCGGNSGKRPPDRKTLSRRTAAQQKALSETAVQMNAARRELQTHLEQMQQKGIKLFVDGEAAPPGKIAAKAVCEGSSYMADYVLGETGAIEQVRFDKVKGH